MDDVQTAVLETRYCENMRVRLKDSTNHSFEQLVHDVNHDGIKVVDDIILVHNKASLAISTRIRGGTRGQGQQLVGY